jgi:hypothetical protein
MLSWAQRTAQWTVKTLPFPLGRSGGPARETTDAEAPQAGDEALTVPAGAAPTGTSSAEAAPAGKNPRRASNPGDHGSRHRASHERVSAPSTRGRHAAPSRSRRARTLDTD